MDIKTVESLVKLFNEEGLTKLKVSGNDGAVHIEKNHGGQPAVAWNDTPEDGKTSEPDTSDSGLLEITAEQVGTFYTSKEEDSDEAFVEEGDSVEKGDTVGLIEAMKVFNDVTSDYTGTIQEIKVENGDTVEFGQVIMTVKPKEG